MAPKTSRFNPIRLFPIGLFEGKDLCQQTNYDLSLHLTLITIKFRFFFSILCLLLKIYFLHCNNHFSQCNRFHSSPWAVHNAGSAQPLPLFIHGSSITGFFYQLAPMIEAIVFFNEICKFVVCHTPRLRKTIFFRRLTHNIKLQLIHQSPYFICTIVNVGPIIAFFSFVGPR